MRCSSHTTFPFSPSSFSPNSLATSRLRANHQWRDDSFQQPLLPASPVDTRTVMRWAFVTTGLETSRPAHGTKTAQKEFSPLIDSTQEIKHLQSERGRQSRNGNNERQQTAVSLSLSCVFPAVGLVVRGFDCALENRRGKEGDGRLVRVASKERPGRSSRPKPSSIVYGFILSFWDG